MRIAVTYGPMCLQRSVEETWNDPRTGSEIGWRRIVEGLRAQGHDVTKVTHAPTELMGESYKLDVAISINEPDSLRGFHKAKLRICQFWLNEFSFCKEGFDSHVDKYFSPSEAHRQKAIGDWGAPRPEKWGVNLLGCDGRAESYGSATPGRTVYCSSPDRGLHRVLEAWPTIKRAVPHATLRVFYRLQKWIDDLKATPYFPPIERNRTRALYIEEALARLSGPEWGITVVDSVPHDEVLREMAQAELLLHPCETLSWSEGFSCTVIDGCSMGAVPVVSDCDALGEVYATLDPFKLGDWQAFRDRTVALLTDGAMRAEYQAKALALAQELTWENHVARLDKVIRAKQT